MVDPEPSEVPSSVSLVSHEADIQISNILRPFKTNLHKNQVAR